MVELIARAPLGKAPLSHGSVTLSVTSSGPLTLLAPFRGKDKAFAAALKSAHGMPAPAPNRATGNDSTRAIWFGHRSVLLAGVTADVKLARTAALIDQSDGWAAVTLQGAGAVDVLARLTPVDLRKGQFKTGHTARTDLQHMMVSITRLSDDSFLILGFRSMADTLWHDLERAMKAVAARTGE